MMKRIFSLILAAVLLCCLLAACRQPPPDAPQDSSESTAEILPPDPDRQAGILMENLGKYVIVYAENSPQSVIDAANSLSASVETKFGNKLRVKSDYYSASLSGSQIGEYEILIGHTNREESERFLDSIGYRDRGYGVIGSKIVIAAHDVFATSQAVSDFNRTVVLRGDPNAEFFYTPEKNYILRGSYAYSELTVNGVSLADYRIVYPKAGEAMEKLIAEKLMYAIANACGAVLRVTDDSQPADGAHEILVGKTNRTGSPEALTGVEDGRGYVSLLDGRILLCGNSALGNVAAVEKLMSLFVGDGNGDALALTIPEGLHSAEPANGSLRAMTFNINSDSVTAERVARVVQTIVQYLPDTVGLQECSRQWKGYLEDQLGAYYEFVGVGADANDTGNACLILYAKEKFLLADSGTRWLSSTPETPSKPVTAFANRIYTWVELERKSDGLRILHLNTQLDTAGVDIRNQEAKMLLDFMESKKELAMILTGDINCKTNTEAYWLLVSAFLRHSADIAEQKSLGSFAGTLPSDVILAYDLYMDVLRYEIADVRVNGDYASDHRAGYAEYIVDYNGTETSEPVKPTDPEGALTLQLDTEGEDYGSLIRFPLV